MRPGSLLAPGYPREYLTPVGFWQISSFSWSFPGPSPLTSPALACSSTSWQPFALWPLAVLAGEFLAGFLSPEGAPPSADVGQRRPFTALGFLSERTGPLSFPGSCLWTSRGPAQSTSSCLPLLLFVLSKDNVVEAQSRHLSPSSKPLPPGAPFYSSAHFWSHVS